MSVLDQDAGRRLVALLHAPLSQHAEAAAAFERGEDVEYRYAYPGSEWRPWVRERQIGLNGYRFTPNWQNDSLVFRIVGTK